jgi:hypothetical protein
MVGLFAFPENEPSGPEAHVGNTAEDGLHVLRRQISQKRVRT